jgi:iron complex outermembrane recepter protein
MRVRDIAFVGVSLFAVVTPAFAEDAAPTKEEAAPEIVVTGTLIRGIAPGGSQLIGVTAEDVAAVGAANTSDLIASVPQAGNFLGFVGIRGSGNFSLALNRPSLRYLGNQSASGASTLLLLDGHRLPGMGITQSSADLDAIAAGAIERVEIVTDGGSATYGSDAIGGVINFITRKQFDGLEAKSSFGFANNYKQYNAGVTVGKVWDSFSAYVSYDYSKHDAIFGRDRDWSQNLDWVNGVGAERDCAVGNIIAGGVVYALPGRTPGIGNRCDNSEDATIYPREVKHSVFGRFGLDTGGPVSLAISGYYVNRKNNSDAGSLFVSGGSPVTSANPFAAPILAALPGAPTSGNVQYNLSPALGNSSSQQTNMESYGFTPTAKIEVGGGWQANAMMNYGIGKNEFLGQLLNATPISSAITAGTFNPFNITAPGNAAALIAAQNFFIFGRAKHQMMNARLVLDGPLFELPAGAVRVAVGVEYYWEKYSGNNGRSLTAAGIAAIVDRVADREVKSAFGEINIPVFGDEFGPFNSLTLTAAGRYDDYSDFGNTFNPKFGANFKPVDWLTVRGNWGKSFQAPGISDIALAGAPSFVTLPFSVRNFVSPTLPAPATRPLFIAVSGTIAPLSPQKATTWSLGFDIKPPALEGFAAGATYYNIDYRGVIGRPPIELPNVFYRDFPDNYVLFNNPNGDAGLTTYFNSIGATNAAATLASLGGNLSRIYGILDSRTQNLARITTTGIDFYARYRHDTSFGDVYLDLSGTRILSFKQQSNPAAALVNTFLLDTTKLRVSATVGANVGKLRAQVEWNHSQGYDIVPTAARLQQDRVGDFNVFNLFMRYQIPGDSGIAKGLAFTLNVDNLLGKDPPLFRGSGSSLFGAANGFTLGRVVKVGVTKKF